MPYLALVALVAAFLYFHHKQAQAWEKERRGLLSRIQTPQMAASLAPVEPPEDEPEGYREWDEYRQAAGFLENGGPE